MSPSPDPSPSKVIEAQGIGFQRQGKAILEGISWTISRGQHWALLGPNGCGKTTLLKILTGYAWPTTGRVRVLGKTYGECDLRELRKNIGWVSAALETRIPAKDNALEVAASGFDASLGLFRELNEDEWGRAREVLDQINAAQFSHQPYGTLSQGEQQRVLIARALVNRPALLILDEPCAGLDPLARHRFLNDLAKLASVSTAPTFILVTHHLEEIGPWISHALVLARGTCVASGRVSQVLTGEVLSESFACPCSVTKDGDGYTLSFNGQ